MRVLILAGTAEALELEKRMTRLEGIELFTSLAGRTRKPKIVSENARIGGFGGVEGLVEYLQHQQIEAVIDATHPFATRMSAQAVEAIRRYPIPHVMFVRPEWSKQEGDNWIEVESLDAAAQKLAQISKRAFLTIGRQEIGRFSHLENIWFLMRMIDPPTAEKIPKGEIIFARGPFTADSERQLMLAYQIDHVVSKNSGGMATVAKIIAARELNLPVIMVKRPIPPPCQQVTDIESAVNWLVNLQAELI